MFDNDFPVAYRPDLDRSGVEFLTAKETSNPRSPFDVYKRPDDSGKNYGPPPPDFQRPVPPVKSAQQHLDQYVQMLASGQDLMPGELPGYGPVPPDSMFLDRFEKTFPGGRERIERLKQKLRNPGAGLGPV